MTIIDRAGNQWELKDAVVRILIEKYPEFLGPEDISSVIKIHPKFVQRAVQELRESNILITKGKTYQIKRGLEGGLTVGRIMAASGEGIINDGIFYFQNIYIKQLFIEGHKSKYLEYPEIPEKK